MGRTKDSVAIDKYALENAMLANETTSKEVSIMLGHAGNYLSQCVKSWYMKRKDFENLKGLLRVTDNDIVKAIPVQRSEEVVSIYHANPVRKADVIILDEENEKFVQRLSLFGGGDRSTIVNAIIRDFAKNSSVSLTINAAFDVVKHLTGEATA